MYRMCLIYCYSRDTAITHSVYSLYPEYTLHRAYTMHIPHTACRHRPHMAYYSHRVYTHHGQRMPILYRVCTERVYLLIYPRVLYMITQNTVIANAVQSSQIAGRSPFLLRRRSLPTNKSLLHTALAHTQQAPWHGTCLPNGSPVHIYYTHYTHSNDLIRQSPSPSHTRGVPVRHAVQMHNEYLLFHIQ